MMPVISKRCHAAAMPSETSAMLKPTHPAHSRRDSGGRNQAQVSGRANIDIHPTRSLYVAVRLARKTGPSPGGSAKQNAISARLRGSGWSSDAPGDTTGMSASCDVQPCSLQSYGRSPPATGMIAASDETCRQPCKLGGRMTVRRLATRRCQKTKTHQC